MRPDLKSGRFRFESVLICFLFYGGLAEWTIAAVLKTVDLNGSEGSNPSPSARMFTDTFGTQLSTPQHFFKQCDIYIKNNNLE